MRWLREWKARRDAQRRRRELLALLGSGNVYYVVTPVTSRETVEDLSALMYDGHVHAVVNVTDTSGAHISLHYAITEAGKEALLDSQR